MQGCLLKRVDHTPYTQTDYYRATLQELGQQPPVTGESDSLQVGWAKVNITPPAGSPLAGYGKRRGLRYSAVHDSVWVRTFAFDNGHTEVFFVSLDMLIAPMTVTAELEKAYPELGLKPGQVYLSATHTHTSFGGWGQKLIGWVMAGRYSEQIVKQTAAHIVRSIQLARQNKQAARLGYGEAYISRLVRNRLTGSLAGRDTTVRFFKVEQASGKTAVLATFAAHPTILPSMDPVLSRDYPGEFVDQLEKTVDFAAFSAGAVGSQAVVALHGDSYQSTAAVGQQLAAAIKRKLPAVEMQSKVRLGYSRHRLFLPEPQWRLTDNYRLAPSLFHWLFGKYPTYMNSMQLGEVVLLGVPADYSGELLPELEQQGQPVMVTSFNGGYVGYITPDRYYKLDENETRAMNFYGPQSGSYFTEIMKRIRRSYLLKGSKTTKL
ncbi:neutral/alkaline ceramidase-like enzyme [Pontibacter ramchanderi]|uniref:Neutral ceramidase n=2 Tax=Pontibacter ramchanderi TaxID=1179743 RepID=A0A2N3V3K7_9BACT|nr:neutral/alkaline ceramidase-like enzyme [Pontibacter ramchanderi]